MVEFNHLHTHTEYSLLDGANRIEEIAKTAKEYKQTSLAITDHGNMFGALEHYNTCMKYGIKPIIGCEVYIAKYTHISKHTRNNSYNHLTLIASNLTGYKNLLKLTSLSFIEGLSNRPRISWELLEQNHDGIMCLSGCLSSKLNELILEGKEKEALDFSTHLRDVFGKGNFWLEIQRNGLNIQNKATEGVMRIHQQTGIPYVATNDIHYHRQEDCDFQDTLLCINTGSKKSDTDRFRMDTSTLYLKSTEEMANTFRDIPDAIKETAVISNKINLIIPQGKHIFPKSSYTNPNDSLTGITKQQLIEREIDNDIYHARLEYELKVIKDLGFAEYFLVVRDLIIYARSNGIPVGPGRGSAAGCLISYLLGITSLDPIRHGLLFERFLNSERKGLPDIDIDFCQERRKEVINYLKDKYGDDKVSSIITFGRFGPKKAIRQVARVLSVPLKESDTIAKKLLSDTISDSIAKDATLEVDKRNYPQLFEVAQKVEGYVEYAGTHASGIVIADRPIYEVVPLARLSNGAGESTIVTQWDLESCEKAGLVKFDILGLETLTVIARIERLIKERHNLELTLTKIGLDHKPVYDLLARGDTEGVFQCYSDGMKRLLIQMKPDKFDDIIAAIALFRPGPLESGIADQYIKRKHGIEPVSYTHPDLENAMSNTYGTMVYQEQIMKLASTLAGFSLNEADELRKAVGKKLPEELAKIQSRFIEGCKKLNKVTEDKAKELWEQIKKFGRYGFNQSHSASYGYLTYYTAYLKHFYPTEFFCANLTQEMNNPTKLKAFISDAKKHGITIIKPDIEYSQNDFTITDNGTISIGLNALGGIGNRLLQFKFPKNKYPWNEKGLLQLVEEYPEIKSRSVFEALVYSGSLDGFGSSRSNILNVYNDNRSNANTSIHRHVGLFEQEEIFNKNTLVNITNEDLKNERKVFGFYLSGHPMTEDLVFKARSIGCLSIKEVLGYQTEIAAAKTAGIVTDIEVKAIKSGANKGKKYARILLEDKDEQLVCMLFSTLYDKYISTLQDSDDNGTPITVYGNIEISGDKPAITIKSINTLDNEANDSREFKLRINDKIIERIDDIKKLCLNNPGEKALMFIVSEGYTVATNMRINVTPNFLEQLDRIIN